MSKICDYTKLHVISISFLTTPAISWQSTITATLSTHCFLRLVKQKQTCWGRFWIDTIFKDFLFFLSFLSLLLLQHRWYLPCIPVFKFKELLCLEGQCCGLIVVWYMLNIGLGIGEKYCNAIFWNVLPCTASFL